jgi:hypothetical protein
MDLMCEHKNSNSNYCTPFVRPCTNGGCRGGKKIFCNILAEYNLYWHINKYCMGKLHITGLYTLAPPIRRLGFRSPRSVGLRPRSHGSLHQILGALQTQRRVRMDCMPLRLLIRAPKTSYTARTLCDMGAKVYYIFYFNINKKT